jgi:hypothetical protein
MTNTIGKQYSQKVTFQYQYLKFNYCIVPFPTKPYHIVKYATRIPET